MASLNAYQIKFWRFRENRTPRPFLIDLDMNRTRDELWGQYKAEVATFERFGQKNVISFNEWLDIKGYCKNETRTGI